jgi:hypothetical protein
MSAALFRATLKEGQIPYHGDGGIRGPGFGRIHPTLFGSARPGEAKESGAQGDRLRQGTLPPPSEALRKSGFAIEERPEVLRADFEYLGGMSRVDAPRGTAAHIVRFEQ